MWKFEKLIGHFGKAPDPSHTQANIIPGKQRSSLSLSCSWPALTLASTYSLHGPQGLNSHVAYCLQEEVTVSLSLSLSLSLFLTHLVTHSPVHLHALWGVCDLVALAIKIPMAVQVPHTNSRMESEMKSSQEQARLPGWGLWQPPAGSKALYFKLEQELWTLAFVLDLLRGWALRWESTILPDYTAPE